MRRTSSALLLFVCACMPADDPSARTDAQSALADSGTPAAASSQPDTMPAHGVVLPDSLGPEMIRQCSRSAPRDARGYWTPGAAEVNAFEKALAPVLQAALDSIGGREGPVRGSDYVRQYVGVVTRDGRRIVYVNGVHRTTVERDEDIMRRHTIGTDSALAAGEPMWRHRPYAVCDGGHYFFGAEYDPATGEVRTLDFNGPG